MSGGLIVHSAGPGVTVQDLGRSGFLAQGLSRGGAADHLALAEGAALLAQGQECAILEMAGFGGVFEPTTDLRIALTGAPMQATVGGEPLVWNASHLLAAGQRLTIGAARNGVFGYLHVGGGFDTPYYLGSRSAHLTAGIGAIVAAGDRLALGPDPKGTGFEARRLVVGDRFQGGIVRIVPSAQTERFSPVERARFEETGFTRDPRGNRQGVRLGHDQNPFGAEGQLNILSEIIVPGDIQITGDGTPYVLLPECQTMGGYPRIGTVVPQDLPIVAQAAPGARLEFRFVPLATALDDFRKQQAALASGLAGAMQPLIRDPRDIADLLSYQLIGGVTDGGDPQT